MGTALTSNTTPKTSKCCSFVSRTIMPSLDRDLARSLTKEVQNMEDIMGCMIAPQVFSYQKSSVATGGAFVGSAARGSPADTLVKFKRVDYPIDNGGLFHE